MIRRHNTSALVMHWVNALFWILLLGSGFALLANPAVQPVGAWWVGLWQNLMGEAGLLFFHMILGAVWAVVYLLYCLFFTKRDVIPFLREITDISLVKDMDWCLRKGLWLILGAKGMRKMGLDPHLPPQGFYNAGQKLVAVVAVLASLLLVITGIILCYSRFTMGLESIVQWSLLIHLCCAGLMAILLPVHIYMAALAPGEGPALRSMITGHVPEEFVKHHNPLWYAKLAAKEGGVPKDSSGS